VGRKIPAVPKCCFWNNFLTCWPPFVDTITKKSNKPQLTLKSTKLQFLVNFLKPIEQNDVSYYKLTEIIKHITVHGATSS